MKAEVITSYFRSLSAEKKQNLINWLLREPLSQIPTLELSPSQPLTSYVLSLKPSMFVEDLTLRISLYEEAIHWLSIATSNTHGKIE